MRSVFSFSLHRIYFLSKFAFPNQDMDASTSRNRNSFRSSMAEYRNSAAAAAAAMPLARWLISNMSSISQQVELSNASSQRPAVASEREDLDHLSNGSALKTSSKTTSLRGTVQKIEQEGSERRTSVRFADETCPSETLEALKRVPQESGPVSSVAEEQEDCEQCVSDIFSQFDLPAQVRSVIEQQRETIALLNREVASLREKQINQNDDGTPVPRYV